MIIPQCVQSFKTLCVCAFINAVIPPQWLLFNHILKYDL